MKRTVLLVLLVLSGVAVAQPINGSGLQKVVHTGAFYGLGTNPYPLDLRHDCATNSLQVWNGSSWICSSGSAVFGGGTANTTTKWTGPLTLGNAWPTDDATTWGVASRFTITEANGNFRSFGTGTIDGLLTASEVNSVVATGTPALVAGTSTKSWTWYPNGSDLNLFEYTTTVGAGGGNVRATFKAGGGLDVASAKITSCANGTVSSDVACFGQIQTGIAADFTGTTNYLPKRTGATTYADSGIADDGTTFLLSHNATLTTLYNTTNFIEGIGINPYGVDGNVYVDSKVASGGFTLFRAGAAAESAAARTWLTITNSTGNATFGFAETVSGALTASSTAHIVGALTEDAKSTLSDRVDFGKSGAVSYTSITNRGVLDYDTAIGNAVLAAQNSGGASHVLIATSNSANAATQLDIGPTGVTVPGTFGVSGVATFSNPATNGVVVTNSTTSDTGLELINGAAGGRSFTVGSGATASTAPNAFYVRDVTGSTNRLKLGATAATINAVSTDTFTIHGATSIDAALDMGSHLIDNVTDPSGAQDAATKNYVDTHKGIFIARQVLSASSGTYTPTSGTKRVLLREVGGGGGGGGAVGSGNSGGAAGGGASGYYYEKWIDPGATVTGGAYACGAAGTAGTAGANNGGVGGDTTVVINGTTYTAKGGSGGPAESAAATTGTAGGDVVTSGSTGDINSGQPGGSGIVSGDAIAISGHGGSNPFGAGGVAKAVANTFSSAGSAGHGNGAGGGGAVSLSVTSVAGGAGTIGIIIIDEYQLRMLFRGGSPVNDNAPRALRIGRDNLDRGGIEAFRAAM